jgi:hypothetical protein
MVAALYLRYAMVITGFFSAAAEYFLGSDLVATDFF